jgi:trimethylamine:corrinoid methyltransferase-like protein
MLMHRTLSLALRQCITELTVNESVCTTEDEILNGWREHFLKLATPVDDCEYNNIYRRQTEEDLNNIIDICEHQSYSINITDNAVLDAISSLKRNKAPDIYYILEHRYLWTGPYVAPQYIVVIYLYVC